MNFVYKEKIKNNINIVQISLVKEKGRRGEKYYGRKK